MRAGLIFSVALSRAAIAQPEPLETDAVPAPPVPIYLAPTYEGGPRQNRGLSVPVNLRFAPEQRLSVGYTASNSYLNAGILFLDRDVTLCNSRLCRVFYETDHSGNLLFVNFTQPLSSAWEFGVGIATYELDKPASWSPVHQFVSDGILRRFHEDILREDSLPVLSEAPDDRRVFSLTDYEGRQLVLEPGRTYPLPLRLDLVRYFELKTSGRASMGLNLGLHLSYPLEGDRGPNAGQTAFARGADFGIAVNFTRSLRHTRNLSSTYHVQVARFRSGVHIVNPNSPRIGDDDLRSQYALTYGLHFGNTFSGNAPCSFSISQLTASAEYDKNLHNALDPVVFDGGNNLRAALAGANDYGVFSFACEYRQRHWQVSMIEDMGGFSEVFTGDGASSTYDSDFAVSVSASWRIGAPREQRRRD